MSTTTHAKTILITGASAGIGRDTAIRLAERGHRIIATARRREKLEALASEHAGITAVPLDVTDASSIARARTSVLELTDGYGVDAIINNAGYGQIGPLELIDDEALRRQFDTNVFGLMAVTRAFLPEMRERGHGRVVNISSLGGRIAFPLMGAYTATKFALEALSDSLRLELRPFGVRVVLIEPGVIRTEFADTAINSTSTLGQGSVYQPALERLEQLNAQMHRTAVSTRTVTRAIQAAIERRRPRARYVAPVFAGLGVGLLRRLPTALTDWLMRSFAGLTPKRLVHATSGQARLTDRAASAERRAA
ncbi:MAG: SDR family oxidoreductase [Myxococcales bacterium]|nr:SDR family oxidoreductase [Myxococcales bacterium]